MPPDSGKRKRIVVEISSSDEESSIASDSDVESMSEGDDSDFVADDEDVDDDDSVRDSDEDDDEDEGEEDDDDNGDENGKSGIGGEGTEEERCRRVVDRLEKQRNLDILKLEDCKAYLRKHSLRLSGSKSTCIKRIMEHWRIKDTDGEKLYPRASFTINCTGDVCKGDVVLFRQRVYDKFDKVKRSSKIVGKRTVAGRIVKESYGTAKQQHTFTVEVLWTKGQKVLPPLYPLLVKGRNLYRLKTFRQPWSNEVERKKVLDEKHRRGAVARQIRQTRKTTNGSSSHEHLPGKRHAPKLHTKEQLKHGPKKRKQNNPPDKSRHCSSVKTGHGAKKSVMTRNAPAQERSQRYTNYGGESQCHPPGMMNHIPTTRNPSVQFQDRQAHYSERVTHYQHPFPPRMPFNDNYDGLNTRPYPALNVQPHGNFASHHNRWNSAQVPRQPTFFQGSSARSDTQFYWWRRP